MGKGPVGASEQQGRMEACRLGGEACRGGLEDGTEGGREEGRGVYCIYIYVHECALVHIMCLHEHACTCNMHLHACSFSKIAPRPAPATRSPVASPLHGAWGSLLRPHS